MKKNTFRPITITALFVIFVQGAYTAIKDVAHYILQPHSICKRKYIITDLVIYSLSVHFWKIFCTFFLKTTILSQDVSILISRGNILFISHDMMPFSLQYFT